MAQPIARAKEIIDRYADLGLALADASIVVLAERHSVDTVLSLDQRHFRAMRIERRKRFKVLPFDSYGGISRKALSRCPKNTSSSNRLPQ